MTTETTKTEQSKLAKIAKRHFYVETLETRHSDSLDFYEVSVWGIEEALVEAFELGKQAAMNEMNND